MAITLTVTAANHIQQMLNKRGKGLGIRIRIKTTGCSGYSYVLDYADEVSDVDHVFKMHGASVVVDPDSLKLIDGTEVDFVQQGLESAFRFNNPKAASECGCGESFSTKKD